MDVVIAGAGVVGLACAAELARAGHSVIVVERNKRVGEEVSARNSQVIHAGLYYAPGSLKAQTCVGGRARLYKRCEQLGIAHRRTGKLVVAVDESERSQLEDILKRGTANGAGDLRLLDAAELRVREPRVRGVAALWSPESGIFDAHELVASYRSEAESHGADVVLRTRVVGLENNAGTWSVHTQGDDGEAFTLRAPVVINAAGLAADSVATMAGLDVDRLGLRLFPCKGDYYSVSAGLGRLTQHLVYPLPAKAGLGIHITFDMTGRYILGPDTTYVDALSYQVDETKAEAFAASVARYFPELRAEHIAPDYAGIRPKLQPPGGAVRDFVIEEASPHGAPGLINLIGIESPGLTAAGDIAARVAAMVHAIA